MELGLALHKSSYKPITLPAVTDLSSFFFLKVCVGRDLKAHTVPTPLP